MILGTEEAQARWAEQARRDLEREKAQKYAENIFLHAKVLDDHETSPENIARQMGQAWGPRKLEDTLKKISHNFFFEDVIDSADPRARPKFRRLLFRAPGGIEMYLGAYHNDIMPEYSIFDSRIEEVPDPTVRHADRKDFPKAAWKGLEYDPDTGDVRGEGWRFDPHAPRPGLVRVKRPWNEIKRGWRTVLARVVQAGLASPEQVERLVGGSERPSWAGVTGKLNTETPF